MPNVAHKKILTRKNITEYCFYIFSIFHISLSKSARMEPLRSENKMVNRSILIMFTVFFSTITTYQLCNLSTPCYHFFFFFSPCSHLLTILFYESRSQIQNVTQSQVCESPRNIITIKLQHIGIFKCGTTVFVRRTYLGF